MSRPKRKSGLTWHRSHDELVEWCWDYDGRLEAIEKKPPHEVPTRKRLFQFVSWPAMPEDVRKALAACDEAWAAPGQARAALSKAEAARDKAWTALALDAVLQRHATEIEAMHRVQCSNCPWDGRTMFPKEGKP